MYEEFARTFVLRNLMFLELISHIFIGYVEQKLMIEYDLKEYNLYKCCDIRQLENVLLENK